MAARKAAEATLKLSPVLRRLIMESDLTERHARALLALPDEKKRLEIAAQAIEKNLTVRQVETLVLEASEKLALPLSGRHVVSLARDHRLYLNAIKGIVEQMRQTGVDAQIRTTEYETSVEVRIVFPKQKQ